MKKFSLTSILVLGMIVFHMAFMPSALFALENLPLNGWTTSPLLALPSTVSEPDEFRALSPAVGESRVSRAPDMGKIHKYLGYGTLILAVGAAISSSNKDVHEPMGYTAATAATLTCISGFMEYSDYFDTDEGFSTYNIHIVSGVAATAGFIVTAILGAGGDDHGGIGGGSTVLMAVPVIILKW